MSCDAVSVESLELVERHALDIATDAPLAERECHPGFETRDDSGRHLRVRVQVVIEPVRPRIHQVAQPLRARVVLSPHVHGIDEQLHAQVPPDLCFSLGLGQATLRVEEIHLDPVEVVFGLSVDHAEHGVRVGLAVDVWDAPVVSDDRDALGLLLPGGHCRVRDLL